jgi:hypothetical protein
VKHNDMFSNLIYWNELRVEVAVFAECRPAIFWRLFFQFQFILGRLRFIALNKPRIDDVTIQPSACQDANPSIQVVNPSPEPMKMMIV